VHLLPCGAPIGSINPSTKTKAEWAAYIKADKHAKGKDTVKQYVSKAYRASIKSGNKAAEKFADTPDQELLDDVAAFLTKGAKDGDAPGQLQLIHRGLTQARRLPGEAPAVRATGMNGVQR
jgi:hypothetical protein